MLTAQRPHQRNKSRKRGRNTKTGCRTCKIRRKKCDENQPACIRCSSTGRTCDFLAQNKTNASMTHDRIPCIGDHTCSSRSELIASHPRFGRPLPLLPLENLDEANYFDFFRLECTKEFSQSFNASLWGDLILQAAYFEPFVFHAVLAIGRLRRMQLFEDSPQTKLLSQDEMYSTKKYALALQLLRHRLLKRTVGLELTLLATLVFLALEVLQGNEQGALTHFESGRKILRSLNPTIASTRNYASDLECLIADDIVAAFARLGVEEELFVGIATSSAPGLPRLPPNFESIVEARAILNTLISVISAFLRRNGRTIPRTLASIQLSKTASVEFQELRRNIHRWHFMLQKLQTPDAVSRAMTDILFVQYHVTVIRPETYFHATELIYDEYTPQFQEILDLTSTVIRDQNVLQDNKGPCFTLDIAMAQPLYFVARKCRVHSLRMGAIDEMKKVGTGIYTGRSIAKLAEWVINTETRTCGKDFVPETDRLRDVKFDFDRMTRSGRVSAWTGVGDGSFEFLTADVDMC